jgi:hypothetical protein
MKRKGKVYFMGLRGKNGIMGFTFLGVRRRGECGAVLLVGVVFLV